MSDAALALTVYFGEGDRVEGELVCDALLDRFEHHRVQAALLLRATEGYGATHALRTERLLSLSEDLPLVATAVDAAERIEALVPTVAGLLDRGLVTVERSRLARGVSRGAGPRPTGSEDGVKLTVYLGRLEHAGGRPAYRALVDLLRREGVAGATVFLGVDGMLHGRRQRATFFSTNTSVPLAVVSVGSAESVGAALPLLDAMLDHPLATLERVRVCKRDGIVLAEPHRPPEEDPSGMHIWQKLTVLAGEQARHEGRPLYVSLVRSLREAGAAGATALRGVWGYSGDHPPHGDSPRSIRRRVPVATVVVDRPREMARWWTIVDALTDEAGLVTSELVPAFRAVGPSVGVGGLRLASIHADPG